MITSIAQFGQFYQPNIHSSFLFGENMIFRPTTLQGSPVFRDTVRELIRWMNQNQGEFIVVDLIDFVSMETSCKSLPELRALLKLFGSRLLKPADVKVGFWQLLFCKRPLQAGRFPQY
jgi:hypothetical protein